jgi:hypothetical protein
MTRECWVYPDDGPPYRKGERPYREGAGYATVLPDLPDFVSPIDGKLYSGRAGLRDHCARHNVVPTADLKGLPPLPATGDTRSPEQKKADASHRKQLIINQVNKHYR